MDGEWETGDKMRSESGFLGYLRQEIGEVRMMDFTRGRYPRRARRIVRQGNRHTQGHNRPFLSALSLRQWAERLWLWLWRFLTLT